MIRDELIKNIEQMSEGYFYFRGNKTYITRHVMHRDDDIVIYPKSSCFFKETEDGIRYIISDSKGEFIHESEQFSCEHLMLKQLLEEVRRKKETEKMENIAVIRRAMQIFAGMLVGYRKLAI